MWHSGQVYVELIYMRRSANLRSRSASSQLSPSYKRASLSFWHAASKLRLPLARELRLCEFCRRRVLRYRLGSGDGVEYLHAPTHWHRRRAGSLYCAFCTVVVSFGVYRRISHCKARSQAVAPMLPLLLLLLLCCCCCCCLRLVLAKLERQHRRQRSPCASL